MDGWHVITEMLTKAEPWASEWLMADGQLLERPGWPEVSRLRRRCFVRGMAEHVVLEACRTTTITSLGLDVALDWMLINGDTDGTGLG